MTTLSFWVNTSSGVVELHTHLGGEVQETTTEADMPGESRLVLPFGSYEGFRDNMQNVMARVAAAVAARGMSAEREDEGQVVEPKRGEASSTWPSDFSGVCTDSGLAKDRVQQVLGDARRVMASHPQAHDWGYPLDDEPQRMPGAFSAGEAFEVSGTGYTEQPDGNVRYYGAHWPQGVQHHSVGIKMPLTKKQTAELERILVENMARTREGVTVTASMARGDVTTLIDHVQQIHDEPAPTKAEQRANRIAKIKQRRERLSIKYARLAESLVSLENARHVEQASIGRVRQSLRERVHAVPSTQDVDALNRDSTVDWSKPTRGELAEADGDEYAALQIEGAVQEYRAGALEFDALRELVQGWMVYGKGSAAQFTQDVAQVLHDVRSGNGPRDGGDWRLMHLIKTRRAEREKLRGMQEKEERQAKAEEAKRRAEEMHMQQEGRERAARSRRMTSWPY